MIYFGYQKIPGVEQILAPEEDSSELESPLEKTQAIFSRSFEKRIVQTGKGPKNIFSSGTLSLSGSFRLHEEKKDLTIAEAEENGGIDFEVVKKTSNQKFKIRLTEESIKEAIVSATYLDSLQGDKETAGQYHSERKRLDEGYKAVLQASPSKRLLVLEKLAFPALAAKKIEGPDSCFFSFFRKLKLLFSFSWLFS